MALPERPGRRPLPTALTLLATLAVTGCLTATFTDGPDVDPAEARTAREVAARACRLVPDQRLTKAQGAPMTGPFVINEIKHLDEGWTRADITTQGLRDHVFWRLETGEVHCGLQSWQARPK